MTTESSTKTTSEDQSPAATPEHLELVQPGQAIVVVYEYGARVDKDTQEAVHEQLFKAHTLYNRIVEEMERVVREIGEVVLEAAEPRARELDAEITSLNEAWVAAKAANDEDAMKRVATRRREARRELWPLLTQSRKACVAKTRPLYARIGRNSASTTYQLRCKAVDEEGLGWATANAVLDAALQAWKKSSKMGRAPRFARYAEKTQRSLTLQFTKAGGVPAQDLLSGKNKEFLVKAPDRVGRTSYGTFSFRLGPASAKCFATGTWGYHRAIPDGAHVSQARLVARRVANKTRYALQLMVTLAEPIHLQPALHRSALVALHLGWAADETGRHVGAMAAGADPGSAELLQLPVQIERDLEESSSVQSKRSEALLAIVKAMRERMPDTEGLPEVLSDELAALRRTRDEHVASRRLYRLIRLLEDAGLAEHPLCVLLAAWRREDRKRWQCVDGLARSARGRRADFYRKQALARVRQHACIAVSPLDLVAAAEKIDPESGERTEFARKARAGRVVAALSEFRSALEWACTRMRTPLVEVHAGTASRCPYCGADVAPLEETRELLCGGCGAAVDRKLAGAANAYQLVAPHLDAIHAAHGQLLVSFWEERDAAREERKAKMAEGRAKARLKAAHVDETEETNE